MKDNYEITKNLEQLEKYGSTRFLDGYMQKELRKRMKKRDYQIFSPYPESEKVLFYQFQVPKISLLKVHSKETLSHSDILGSLFALGLDSSVFGDIILKEEEYYIFVLFEMKDFFLTHLREIKHSSVWLEEVDQSFLSSFQRKYEKIELIVSSERVDTVISRLLHTNRDSIKEKMKDKEIILNYEVLRNPSKLFHEGDIFSIRRVGKFRYEGVYNQTKSGNYVITVLKYL